MTPIILMEDLKSEFETMFEHRMFKYPEANEERKLNVFMQNLPQQNALEEDDQIFPYILITVEKGNTKSEAPKREMKIDIIIGAWDDSVDMQGYRIVLNVIEKIQKRFAENPIITKFRAMDDVEWALSDDDTATAPYYYGILSMTFQLPIYRREDI